MAGITACGAYVPIYRLSREEIARVWGGEAGGGERAVANFDEDSLTMGVEAAIDCLGDTDRSLVDGLYFASTTPPYREKQAASIIAAALCLRNDVFTADFTDSLRGGTSALRAALDAVNSGSARNVLVVASDCRLPAPNSEFEMTFGDGAAAFLVGTSDVLLDVVGVHSETSDFLDIWRLERDVYPRTWEDRFIMDEGYLRALPQAVSTLLKKSGLTVKDLNRAALYAPDSRRYAQAVKSLGLDKKQTLDSLFNTVGNTGAALAPMMLAAVLEEAKAGDRILFAAYGDGCDAFVLQVTDRIGKTPARRGMKRHLQSNLKLSGYGKYVHFRNLMTWEPDKRPPEFSSGTAYWRDRREIMGLIGKKCRKCGNIQIDFPLQRVCGWCRAQDDFEPVRLSDRKGSLFTFSMDERARVLDLPSIMCVVDVEGGGRFFTQMTDREPEKVAVGMPLEFTFRNLHDGMGVHNYFWKARPVRCQEA